MAGRAAGRLKGYQVDLPVRLTLKSVVRKLSLVLSVRESGCRSAWACTRFVL